MNQKKSKKQTDSQFVCKLCDMMERYPKIINWDDQGQKMVVFNISQLEQIVLHQYFRHSNFASFIRQLNMYDFHKLQKDELPSNYLAAFQHSIFKKGNQRNYHFIQRKRKNKQHEMIILQFQKKYQRLIEKINNSNKLNQQTKRSISKLIEFKFTSTEGIKKIIGELENLQKQLKQCRSKKIAHKLKQIQETLIIEMNGNILFSNNIDKHLDNLFDLDKQNKPYIGNQLGSVYYSSIPSASTYSIRDYLIDCVNINQKPSIFSFPSHYHFVGQMNIHDPNNSHHFFFTNRQFHSQFNYENKNTEITGEQKFKEEDDDDNSMSVVNENQLENILKEEQIKKGIKAIKKEEF